MRIRLFAATGIIAFALAGCGDTFAEQSLLGAGAGAGTAAVLGGSPVLGGLLGAAGNVAYCDRYPSRC